MNEFCIDVNRILQDNIELEKLYLKILFEYDTARKN